MKQKNPSREFSFVPHMSAASSPPPGVLFCADIFHTQGASIYAFRSYLSLVARAAKVLAPIPVIALIPEGSIADGGHGFGFDLAAPFSAESIVKFAGAAGFVWQPSFGTSDSTCSYYDSDVRVGDALHLHRGQAVNRSAVHSAPRMYRDLSKYVEGILRYIRAEVDDLFSWRPGAGLLRVSLLLMHWTSSALSHASVVLPAETALVSRLLAFETRSMLQTTQPCPQDTLRCAYVHVREPIRSVTRIRGINKTRVRGLNVSRTLMPACERRCNGCARETCNGSHIPHWPGLTCGTTCRRPRPMFWREELDMEVKNMYPLELFARDVVRGLPNETECIYVNALVPNKRDLPMALRILEQAVPNGTKVLLSAVERAENHANNLNISIPHPPSPLSRAELPRPWLGRAPARHVVEDFEFNSCARINAVEAAFFMVEAGSHWGDHVLAQRTAANRPSAVLRYVWDPDNEQVAKRDLQSKPVIDTCAQDAGCTNCATFYRGLCMSSFEHPMMAESGRLCSIMYRCQFPGGGALNASTPYRLHQPKMYESAALRSGRAVPF